jgi:large subunit ribosomal protein L13
MSESRPEHPLGESPWLPVASPLHWETCLSTLPGLFSASLGRGAHCLLVLPMKTVFAKSGSVRGDWFLVDANEKTLGRLATQIAHRLKGKHKAYYSPHVDMGDHIVVLNAEKIRVTGRKLTDKFYYHHTGYIGGIKSIALEKLLKEHPERVLEIAVKGMLPKNPLGRRMFRKLHVFAGGEHPHQAQQPKPLEIQ